MIPWDKDAEEENVKKEEPKEDADKDITSKADYIREMENAMDDLCERLAGDSKTFDAKDFFERLHEYIYREDRLLYTNITNYIFALNSEEKFGIMQTNLDSVIKYIYSDQFEEEHPWKASYKNQRNPYERTKRTILKLWDHMNLAKRQVAMFKMKNEDYSKIVDEKMEIAANELSKEVNGQLISLVGIFTALSFLVFGGISSLDNIFEGAKDIPIVKLVIIGLIWSFCIMNLVFVFMFFVAKLSRLNIKSSTDVNANLVQKYPLIWWCNLVLIGMLAISCWMYYVRSEELSVGVYEFLKQHETVYTITGTGIILFLLIAAARKIYKLGKTEKMS